MPKRRCIATACGENYKARREYLPGFCAGCSERTRLVEKALKPSDQHIRDKFGFDIVDYVNSRGEFTPSQAKLFKLYLLALCRR